MFTQLTVAGAFIFLMGQAQAINWMQTTSYLKKPKLKVIHATMAIIGLLCGLFLIGAGFDLWPKWQELELERLNEYRGRHQLAALAIRVWPYVLMGLGALNVYLYAKFLNDRIRKGLIYS